MSVFLLPTSAAGVDAAKAVIKRAGSVGFVLEAAVGAQSLEDDKALEKNCSPRKDSATDCEDDKDGEYDGGEYEGDDEATTNFRDSTPVQRADEATGPSLSTRTSRTSRRHWSRRPQAPSSKWTRRYTRTRVVHH